jgi:hypothetical protein
MLKNSGHFRAHPVSNLAELSGPRTKLSSRRMQLKIENTAKRKSFDPITN